MSGFIHRQVLPASRNRHSHKSNPHPFNAVQVSHDPDNKIVLAKGTKFKNVFTKTCLMKTYPQEGRYAGGIVFRRCYSVGEGVGFTKEECAKMWGDVKLDDHIMLVGGGTTTTTNTPTSTTAAINTPTISHTVTTANNHNTCSDTTTPTTTTTTTTTATINASTLSPTAPQQNNHTTTPDTTTPTTTTTTNTTTAPSTTACTIESTPIPGDCVEVWWEGEKEWFAGVITDEAPGYDDSISSQIEYDDDKKRYWHNLEVIVTRVRV